jgi:hypothetical protein
MPTNGETWIKVHDSMPDHHKISGLSDKAFRFLIETWCWCSRQRNEGHFPVAAWQRMGTVKTRTALEAAELVEVGRYEVVIHDYDVWQTSNEQITTRREKRRRSGSLGNHTRWHLRKGVVDPECAHCSQDRNGVASAIADGSQVGSQTDRKPIAEQNRTEQNRDRDLGSKAPVDQRAQAEDRRGGRRLNPDAPIGPGCSPAAFKIVQAYAATCQRRPGQPVVARLGVEVDHLLAASWPEFEIVEALAVWGAKGLDTSRHTAVAHELDNSDKAKRTDYEIPDDQLTDADVAEILGPEAYDPDLPRSGPEDVKTRAALAAWRDHAQRDFRRKRRERALTVRRERLGRTAARPS